MITTIITVAIRERAVVDMGACLYAANHNFQFSTFNSQSVENLNSQLFAIRFFSLNSFGSFSHFPLLGTFRGLPFSCLNM